MADTSPLADARPARRSGSLLPPATLLAFAVAALTVLVTAYFSYESLDQRSQTAGRVQHAFETLQRLDGVLSSMKDAETGQRGFLLTGAESYLDPYNAARAAIPVELQRLGELIKEDPEQKRRHAMLAHLVGTKLEELTVTIERRRSGDEAGALAQVRSERGKAAMDGIRNLAAEIETEEKRLLTAHQAAWQDATRTSVQVTSGSSLLLFLLLALAAWRASRNHREREDQDWMRTQYAALAQRLQGEQALETLGTEMLRFLTAALDAPVGALHVRDASGNFVRVAGHALAADDTAIVQPATGLLGVCVQQRRTIVVDQVPEDHLPIESALARGTPRQLLISPASADGSVQGVIELGFLRRIDAVDREFMDRVSEMLGVAVRSGMDRSRLEELLHETQRQSEQLQTQQEELRVNNEELEEQARALKDSQTRLEAQQAELEAGNSQLEEHNQLLETQRDELQRSRKELADKAGELARASQYKSEFLANMSHELRTPLNSTLILSKLLSDNAGGNLTDEQVKFAHTISSAGNDLLLLINDILDLSKIEAGKMEVRIEPVALARVVDSLTKEFGPAAKERGIDFSAVIDPGTPDRIQTDAQRLNQVLRNLLSNAFKFTERGDVALRIHASADGNVAFAVRDTGIGIAPHQHGLIFEAFRQADGSTHRKYGGTGLGLSISRDLARLLGGDIALHSALGEGSTFTLTLPVAYRAEAGAAIPAERPAPMPGGGTAAPLPAPSPPATRRAAATPPPVEDDRQHLTPGTRVLLVIEDDVAFAGILRDLAREQGFQCLLAYNAADGLEAAAAYRPHAVVLDMNLPDHSGLGVLDQLKHDPQTRHIPVHVVSVEDYSQQALERGAIGYALKPVRREQLVDALRRLESRFSQELRRVLVVEDDARQRDSLQRLLGSEGVEITAVETAGDALQRLRETTYDCVVMDVNLPDLSGPELLEKMAEQDDVSFPPVIVYTGRSLTPNEEQELRRFSKSIIVKGARSPERLLDEVTLFLHQVESSLPPESQRMLKAARDRETLFEGRRILIVEDDVRNVFALTSVLESKHVLVEIARNGREALDVLAAHTAQGRTVDMVLMDIMMPEMDGLTAMREIRKRPEWQRLPIVALTAKAMKDDHENCLAAGANDYIAKPLDVERLLSLMRVWLSK